METTFTHRWIRKFRILTICLIFSVAINIGALAIVIVYFVQDMNDSLSYPAPVSRMAGPLEESTNQKLLTHYSRLSFRELAALLTNADFVEEGYRKRDLALSALVAKHHFHLEKALGAMPSQQRFVEANGLSLPLFPGLTDDQFQALIRFAYLEKWPLTGQGLFALLQKNQKPRDASLEQAFILTPEFYALSALFQRCEPQVSSSELIELVCQGTWPMLEGLLLEQSQMLDLSIEKRRRLLLSYLALKSPAAARLLIQTDFDFALKRLEDKGILDLFLCVESADSKLLQTFCLELLKSPRADSVWHKSADLLYRIAGEEPPQSFDRAAALARFVPGAAAPPAPQPQPQPRRNHVVQEGENLWKIARQYKVTVDQIVQLNGLEKEIIRPGMILQMPD